MKTQDRDAPLILDTRIDLAERVLVGNHFAAAAESDMGAIILAAGLLQAYAVSFVLVADARELAYAGHISSPAHLNVIPAQEIILLAKQPPRHVHVHAPHTVVVMGRHLL